MKIIMNKCHLYALGQQINSIQLCCSGIAIRSNMDNSTTVQYTCAVHLLVGKAKSMVRDLDPQNDLTFIRVRSKKNEILIAPGISHHPANYPHLITFHSKRYLKLLKIYVNYGRATCGLLSTGCVFSSPILELWSFSSF